MRKLNLYSTFNLNNLGEGYLEIYYLKNNDAIVKTISQQNLDYILKDHHNISLSSSRDLFEFNQISYNKYRNLLEANSDF